MNKAMNKNLLVDFSLNSHFVADRFCVFDVKRIYTGHGIEKKFSERVMKIFRVRTSYLSDLITPNRGN